MTEQPTALRLADALDKWCRSGRWTKPRYAAAELRRLHSVNAVLLEALRECLPYVGQMLANTGSMDAYRTEAKACAAIARAEKKV
jgi:hypothetical protein